MRAAARRLATLITVILVLAAMIGCDPAPKTSASAPVSRPAVDRESVLPSDASSEEVASRFVESLGNGDVATANALYVGPVFREADEPSAHLVDVSSSAPASASGLDAGWPVQVMYTVSYTAKTGSRRFPKGDGSITVTVVKQSKDGPWSVSGIR